MMQFQLLAARTARCVEVADKEQSRTRTNAIVRMSVARDTQDAAEKRR
jgi:hypothetical protein